MEQDVENPYRTVCSTCLSSDRNLYSISGVPHIYQVFRLLMYDFAGDRFGDVLDMDVLVCWECLALMKRFQRFHLQVHSAQDHLRVLALSPATEALDHTYISQSLSSLELCSKGDYDKIYFDYTLPEQPQQWDGPYITVSPADNVKSEHYDVMAVSRGHVSLDIDHHILEVPEIVLDSSVDGMMPHLVVRPGQVPQGAQGAEVHIQDMLSYVVKGEPHGDPLKQIEVPKLELVKSKTNNELKEQIKSGYITEYMSEAEMTACREEAKQKVQYASSVYKCELCIIGFYTQQQVEDHFVSAHREKPGHAPCKVCYVYVEESKLQQHSDGHYFRYICKLCSTVEHSTQLIQMHVNSHLAKSVPSNVIRIGDRRDTKSRKKKVKDPPSTPPKPGDLRKLLSKTTIEGYQCLECDMFFKNSRARKSHVARFHREGLQCDHCKKRFVNRTTLATHLRLHEGPLPREECPICHKMVRVIQLKYHIKRHQNKEQHVCTDCNKVFSHLATYQAHLKYSRAHASDNVFKFPCPMCNKGYPTKEQMQDHFNYQHLGKTTHKCPVCGKPIASKANVEKHMMRVHGEKRDKPRNHRCDVCGKTFTDKKALTQHEVIHSGERPLSCDICGQTFKQKASLYTHRKRVHKVFPPKRVVEFMDSKPDT